MIVISIVWGLKLIEICVFNFINLEVIISKSFELKILIKVFKIFVIIKNISCFILSIFRIFLCVKFISWYKVNFFVCFLINKWFVYIKKIIIMIKRIVVLIVVLFLIIVEEFELLILCEYFKVEKLK